MKNKKTWLVVFCIMLAVLLAFSLISCTPGDDGGDDTNNDSINTDNGGSNNGDANTNAGTNLVFEVGEDGNYCVVNYTGSEKNVVIPALHDGKAVTRIGSNVFEDNETLESLTLPSSITEIDSDAFKNCSSLKSVYVEDISTILNVSFKTAESNPLSNGADLYVGNELFTTLVLEEGVTGLNQYAFYKCASLKNIVLPSSLKEIGKDAFRGVKIESADIWGTHYTYFPKTDLKTIAFNGKKVYNYFQGLNSLETIVLKEGVEEIERASFRNCTNVKKIVLPTTLKKVEEDAFYNLFKVEEVHISDVASLLKIEKGNVFSSPIANAKKLYLNGTPITEIVVPDSVTEIDDYTFYGAKFLNKIVLNDTITRIGERAFFSADNLNELVFGNSKGLSFGSEAFSAINNESVSVTVPSLEIWMSYNFTAPGSSPVVNVSFYNRSLKFGDAPFDGNLVIPASITAIGDYAFEGVNNMESITIHDGVTSIGKSAFDGCGAIKSVYIGEGVKTVGENAFRSCSVENMEIKANFESVGGGRLNCSISYLEATNNSFPYIDTSTLIEAVVNGEGTLFANGFQYADVLEKVTIGEGITKIPEFAFERCESLTDIVLPSTLEEIESNAFAVCSAIENINFPASLRIMSGTEIDGTAWYNAQPDGVVYAGGVLLKYKGDGENVSVTVKAGTRGIADGAFAGTDLVELIVPDVDSLTYVGGRAIYDTPYLASQPDGAVYVGNCLTSFKGAVEPNTTIVIANGTIMISDFAFDDSPSVKNNVVEIVLPESLEYIGNTFMYVDKLFKLTIPENLKYLHKQAFYGCYGLVEICNNSDIELTNDYAMMQYVKNLYTEDEGQSKLEIANDFVIYTENSERTLVRYYGDETEVVVPLGITIIGTDSIKNPETTKIILPDSVKIIEKNAFYRCQKLKLIVFQKGIENIGRNILYSSGMLDVSLDVKFTGTEEEWKAIEKTGWIYYQSYVVMEYEYVPE